MRRINLQLIFSLSLMIIISIIAIAPAHGTTFTVDSTLDTGDADAGNGICDDGSGNCTLRAAIEEANALTGTHTINFNIAGGGEQTIVPDINLPPIGSNITLDASTQPGSSCGDLWAGTAPTWNIIVQSTGTVSYSGLSMTTSTVSSTIKGFKVTGFDDGTGNGPPGIDLDGTGNTVSCNYVINNSKGIRVHGTDNIVGGSTSGSGNVLSATQAEIIPAIDTVNLVIQGNFIGTNPTGTVATSIGTGINLEGSVGTLIGGETSGAANLISGSSSSIAIAFALSPETATSSRDTTIYGNYIGTQRNGTSSLGNDYGIYVTEGAASTTIGGLSSGQGNVFRWNRFSIVLASSSSGTVIDGNTIANNSSSISVISGLDGVIIRGNYIGTDSSGSLGLGNSSNGIEDSGVNTVIGGTSASHRNVIVGNSGYGIYVLNATSTLIQGNYVGINPDGTTANGNSSSGILVVAYDTTIGGSSAGARNVISGNGEKGIDTQSATASTTIQGNYIGLNASGTSAVINGASQQGIRIQGSGAVIGGSNSGEGNIVLGGTSGSVTAAIEISGSGAIIQGNYTGVNASGTSALGGRTGLQIGGSNHIIGGSTAGARNIFSGGAYGVLILSVGGATTTNNVIQGNYIGVGADGATDLGNASSGILMIGSGITNTLIGGRSSGEGNIIANSELYGISTYDGGSGIGPTGSGNAILGNSIYSNGSLGIDLASSTEGVTTNDTGDDDSGPNDFQNFPVIGGATVTSSMTTVTGTLNSTASETFWLEFFSNDSADSSGYGEGQTFLGTTTVTTDGSGDATFSVTNLPAVTVGKYITMTATNNTSSTSEFSLAVAVAEASSDGGGGDDDGGGDSGAIVSVAGSYAGGGGGLITTTTSTTDISTTTSNNSSSSALLESIEDATTSTTETVSEDGYRFLLLQLLKNLLDLKHKLLLLISMG